VGIPLVWKVELAVVAEAMLAAAVGEGATLVAVGAMGAAAVGEAATVEVMAEAVATPVVIVVATTGETVATAAIVNLAPVTRMCKTPLGWMSVVRNRIHLTHVWIRENFLVVRVTMVKAIL
jgi:hypothetical protein